MGQHRPEHRPEYRPEYRLEYRRDDTQPLPIVRIPRPTASTDPAGFPQVTMGPPTNPGGLAATARRGAPRRPTGHRQQRQHRRRRRWPWVIAALLVAFFVIGALSPKEKPAAPVPAPVTTVTNPSTGTLAPTTPPNGVIQLTPAPPPPPGGTARP